MPINFFDIACRKLKRVGCLEGQLAEGHRLQLATLGCQTDELRTRFPWEPGPYAARENDQFMEIFRLAERTSIPLAALSVVRLAGGSIPLCYRVRLPRCDGGEEWVTLQNLPHDLLRFLTPPDSDEERFVTSHVGHLNLAAFAQGTLVGYSSCEEQVFRGRTPAELAPFRGLSVFRVHEPVRPDLRSRLFSFAFALLFYQTMWQGGLLQNRPEEAPVAIAPSVRALDSWCAIAGIPLTPERHRRKRILTHGELAAMWTFAEKREMIEPLPVAVFSAEEAALVRTISLNDVQTDLDFQFLWLWDEVESGCPLGGIGKSLLETDEGLADMEAEELEWLRQQGSGTPMRLAHLDENIGKWSQAADHERWQNRQRQRLDQLSCERTKMVARYRLSGLSWLA